MRIRPLLALLLAVRLLVPAQAARADAGSTLVFERGSTGMAESSSAGIPAGASGFTGAATYSLPIEVAPGTAGMQPSLSLTYSSHAARESSWVGTGWSLAGLGAISRSLKDGVPDYVSPTGTPDQVRRKLVLDGQELVKDAEGFYHTRRESFLRIEHLPPDPPAKPKDSWEVRAKDGTISRYGSSDDCRIENGVVGTFAWLLCERVDRNGNGLKVSYDDTSDAGTRYPKEIRYTLRPGGSGLQSITTGNDRVVSFVLEDEDRPDPTEGYRAGFREEQTKRLREIDVRVDGNLAEGGILLRRYQLDYGAGTSPDSFRSLLRAVRLYGTDADGGSPTPRVWDFTYRASTPGWQPVNENLWEFPSNVFFTRSDGKDGGTRLADMNGDGLPDLVREVRVAAVAENDAFSGVYLNDGAGFLEREQGESWRFPYVTVPQDIADATGRAGGSQRPEFVQTFDNGNVVVSRGTVAADITGDGRADLVVAQSYIVDLGAPTLTSYSHLAARANPGAPTPPVEWPDLSPANPPGQIWGFSLEAVGNLTEREAATGLSVLADLNGDGRQDLVTRGVLVEDQAENWVLLNRYDASSPGTRFEPSGSSAYTICNLGDEDDPDLTCLKRGAIARLIVNGVPTVDFVQDHRLGKRMIDVNGDGLDDHVVALGPQLIDPDLAAQTCQDPYDCAEGFDCDGNLPEGVCRRTCWSSTEEAVCPIGTGCGIGFMCRPEEYKKTLLNLGGDFASASSAHPKWRVPVNFDWPVGNETAEAAVRFVDLNGDGRVDLVQGPSSGASIWLNLGHPDHEAAPYLLMWKSDSAWALPPGAEVVDADGKDRGVRFADLDGDGMVDIVRAVEGPASQVWLNQGAVPDLLETVTTPLGGSTRFEYTPSTSFDHTHGDGDPDLAQVLHVVTKVEVDDDMVDDEQDPTEIARTFTYEGGLFDRADREFRGFRKVTAIDNAGRRIETTFHQSAALAGLPEKIEIFAAGSNELLRGTEYEYTPDDDGVEPFVSLPAAVEAIEADGPLADRRTRTTFAYDEDGAGVIRYGNLVTRIEYGEVVGEGNTDVTESDTRVTELTYTTNDDPANGIYLVDRVATHTVRRGVPVTGAPERRTRFYYDGHSAFTDPPTQGNLTRLERLVPGGTPTKATTTFGYDEYGNVESITSPRAPPPPPPDAARTRAG